jgi:hypothetical protein
MELFAQRVHKLRPAFKWCVQTKVNFGFNWYVALFMGESNLRHGSIANIWKNFNVDCLLEK